MKIYPFLFLFILYINASIAQVDDITKSKEFSDMMWLKATTQVEKSTLYFKKGEILEGYMAFDANGEDPNFLYADMTRFCYSKDGKLKFKNFSTGKLDSFTIGDRKYKFMDIKVSAGIVALTQKNSIYRIVNDFQKSALIKYVPNELDFAEKAEGQTPLDMIWNKTNNKFFQLETGLGSFTKGLKKVFDDCESLVNEIESKANAEPKKSILSKALNDDTEKNLNTALEACKSYDECATSSSKKKK